MRALLVALSIPDPASLRAALSAALGTSSVDLCQTPEAAVTWLENRPCDLVAIAGQGAGVVEGVARPDLAWRPLVTVVALALVPALLWRRSRPLLTTLVGWGAAGRAAGRARRGS